MREGQPLILASTSPRRQFLMKEAGFQFRIEKPMEDETFPDTMPVELVPSYLAEKKATGHRTRVADEIVITSDTVVILNETILNKPLHREEAIDMLSRLAGRTHVVITAVCLLSKDKEDLFDERTQVTFKPLGEAEISRYVDHFKPYDKAGAYGAQEFLPPGMNPCSADEIRFLKEIGKLDIIEKSITTKQGSGIVGIDKIEGSYFNVMGFPIHKVYEHLRKF